MILHIYIYMTVYIYIYIYYINGTEGPGYIWQAVSSMGRSPSPGYKFSKSLDFSRYGSDFWTLPKTHQNGHLQKPSKNIKIEPLDARGLDFGSIFDNFGDRLSSNLMI